MCLAHDLLFIIVVSLRSLLHTIMITFNCLSPQISFSSINSISVHIYMVICLIFTFLVLKMHISHIDWTQVQLIISPEDLKDLRQKKYKLSLQKAK